MPGLVFELCPPESRRQLIELARFLSRGTRHLDAASWRRLQRAAREHRVPELELERILDELSVRRPSQDQPGPREQQEDRASPVRRLPSLS